LDFAGDTAGNHKRRLNSIDNQYNSHSLLADFLEIIPEQRQKILKATRVNNLDALIVACTAVMDVLPHIHPQSPGGYVRCFMELRSVMITM